MAQDRKKQVSGEIPFDFMQVLTDAVCISDEPEERRATALKSLANGGEGFCERF